MDEVDLEDAEDLTELEARLYAQIHHEPSSDLGFSTPYEEALPVRQVTATSVINNKTLDRTRVGRYWNDKKDINTPPRQTKSLPPDLGQTAKEQQNNVSSTVGGDDRESPAETVDKSFQPSVKNLSNLRVNPIASGNDPNKKGSTKTNSQALKAKKSDQKEKGPFGRQLNKLANAEKYAKKRQKAENSKKKANNDIKVPAIEPTDPIEVLSSHESDTDDVIEVPLSPEKILTIDSSSDEEVAVVNKAEFIKPQAAPAAKENPSRCTSPCSVISDDFISQSDRMRHSRDYEGPDDEDLLLLQEDVDSLMENPQKNASEKPTQTADYRVTQSTFRAFDVYESESDIQDSVYSKGVKNKNPSVVVRLEHESSSGDEVEEVCVTQKTKRFRKRATSSNKESDTHIDSTDSEEENQNDKRPKSGDGVARTSISFIAQGEALEKYLTEEPSEGLNKTINSSDSEFLSTLRALAQGTSTAPPKPTSKLDSDEEDETITARAIAEKVLEKENANKQPSEPTTTNSKDASDAVPADSFQELSATFDKIDDLDKSTVVVDDDSDDSNKSVELVAPLPVVAQSEVYRKSIETETGDPIYHIVYSEGNSPSDGGIGWNDEMRKFYNASWKGERFNVNSICSQMKTAKSLWKIYTDDRFPKFRKNSNLRCLNCCEFGHYRSKCTKPKKPLICYMCGEKGHHEPRCPNTVCLRCGNKTRMFTRSCNACNYQNRLICPICKVRGHNLNLCPDKWRRYHSTTKPNEYPNSNVEYKNRKFCCICGCRGHLAEHCRNGLRYTEYPIFISEIRSHQKSYDDIAIKSLRTGIGYNLMYKPEEDLAFSLAENKTKQHYYGRFLIAVGMGYLLRRKRKIDEALENRKNGKQPKTTGHFKEYVINPFAKAALEKPAAEKPAICEKVTNERNKQTEQPVVEVPSKNPENPRDPEDAEVNQSIDEGNGPEQVDSTPPDGSPASAFKMPDVSVTTGSSRKDPEIEVIDSDSNYSFSDHFETTPQQKPQEAAPVSSNTVSNHVAKNPLQKAREMAPLPDFIPITDDGDFYPDETVGISNQFVSADTDDEEMYKSLNDIPCEAKIYLTNFHSKFLVRPEGNKFLLEKSKACNIKVRLDYTSVGDMLVLFGLREDQDKFHMELLHRFRELSDVMNRRNLENSQKVPKRTDVLIRFLRESLTQLLSDLGNVYELSKRLPKYEQQNTKNGWKAAEKTRRLLNMILIGQAGLRNGSTHLDNLLSHLRRLIDDHKEEVVPQETREDIENHWKLIFSSYRHENYDQLVEIYRHVAVKNRFQILNIDPRLLGNSILDTSLTKAQKDKMNKWTEEVREEPTAVADKQCSASPKVLLNPMAAKLQARRAKTPTSEKKRLKQSTNPANQLQQPQQQALQQSQQQAMAINSPVANKINAVNAEWENKCVNLLTEISGGGKVKSGPTNDSKCSSVFWSREAMPFIDECMQLGKTNPGLMEKLARVQIKSSKGLLSYNDYRAVIKIHNAIKGKK